MEQPQLEELRQEVEQLREQRQLKKELWRLEHQELCEGYDLFLSASGVFFSELFNGLKDWAEGYWYYATIDTRRYNRQWNKNNHKHRNRR